MVFFVVLGKESKLKGYGDRVLRKIVGSEKEDVM